MLQGSPKGQPHDYQALQRESIQAGNMLAKLVYRSRAARKFSPFEVQRLALDAQVRNRRQSITGLLVYDEDCFIQWLEGPADSLSRLMQTIRSDPRHTDIEILTEQPAAERVFGEWNMKLAARSGRGNQWNPGVIELSTDAIRKLRQRPEIAPALIADSRPVPAPGKLTPTASVVQEVVLSTVIPKLVAKHLAAPAPQQHRRVADLAAFLIADDPAPARELLATLHAAEGTLFALYTNLIEPVSRALGDLWQRDECSLIEVTLALARLQREVRALSTGALPHLAATGRLPAVLITPEPGEVHLLGATLDSEVLWHAGWAPHSAFPETDVALQDLVAGTWFDVLDLSLSGAFRRDEWLPRVTETIARARFASRNPALIVVVGGRVFVEQAAAAAIVGADVASLTAQTIDQAILNVMRRNDIRKQA
jgi:hypothetical protein